MKGSFIKKLHQAFALGVFLIMISSLATYLTIRETTKKAEWIYHTEQVKEELEILLSSMKDADTGVREFIITNDPTTLEPYNGAYQKTIQSYSRIKYLTADNAEQQYTLLQLKAIIPQKFNLLAKQKNRETISSNQIKEGKNIMDQARKIIAIMKAREQTLLNERINAWKTIAGITTVLIILLALIAASTSYYFYKQVKITYYRGAKLQHALQRKSIETDARLTIIQQVADKIAQGDYSSRIHEKESDILGSLAINLNRMASSLEYSFKALKELMSKKDDFIGIAAHELKTPLTSIKAYLQFVGRIKFTDEESRKIYPFVNKANSQVNRLTEIIKDLLDVARINDGHLGLKLSDFSLRDAIVSTSEELLNSIRTHEIHVQGNPDVIITADKFRIEQVLINLISNAIKYSPNSNRIIVDVKKEDQAVKVLVKDFGIGIPQEKLPLIFERYFRVEQTSQNYSGMGLGLYISKGIVEKHSGQIGVLSKYGEGSIFWFTLPNNVDKS